jgi:ribonuclease III
MEAFDTTALEQKLTYHFKNKALLVEALSHSSFVNEQPLQALCNNERLEFLGDAVLNLIVGHLLMKRFPELREGELSRLRAQIVNESQLALIARTLDLGSFVLLGKGETLTNGHDKNSILANTLEAVIAAVYLDSGFQAAFEFIAGHFEAPLDSKTATEAFEDYKSRLQELVQTTTNEPPQYNVIEEIGPDHDKTFRIQLIVGAQQTEGVGKSKKMAEQDAARKYLESHQQEPGAT